MRAHRVAIREVHTATSPVFSFPMQPTIPFHEGCYCYRDEEAESARQAGVKIRCGGGLPCCCLVFDDLGLPLDDPLFATDWQPPDIPASDAFTGSTPPLWPSVDTAQASQPAGATASATATTLNPTSAPSLLAPSPPLPANVSAEFVASFLTPLPSSLSPLQPTTAKSEAMGLQPLPQPAFARRPAGRKGATSGNPAGAGCGCPCKQLHIMQIKKRKRCCGSNCQCRTGECSCPEHVANSTGKCCDSSTVPILRRARNSAVPTVAQGASSSAPLDPLFLGAPVTQIPTTAFSKVMPGAFPADLQLHAQSNARPRGGCCSSVGASAQPPTVAPVRCALVGGRASSTAPVQSAPVPTSASSSATPTVKAMNKSEDENCEACDMKFTTRRELETHNSKKHAKDRPFTCTLCTSTFLFKQNRDRHIVEVHYGKRPHQCPHDDCASAFKNSSGLKQHMRTVHDKERPFQCEQCTASFGQRNHLTQHVLVVHERQKLFKCDACGTSFSNRGNLNQHVRRKHSTAAPSSPSGRSRARQQHSAT